MNRLDTLWNGYRTGMLTPEELQEFLSLVRQGDPGLAGKIDELLEQHQEAMPAPGERERILQQVMAYVQHEAPVVRTLPWWKRYQYAAAIFLLLAGAATWWSIRHRDQASATTTAQHTQPAQQDIAPGRNGAILTLADGSTRLLDSAANGTIATQGQTQVELQDGQLVYRNDSKENTVSFNTMTTPRGRQFSVVLPDGSKVWLNAASSLTYPTAFIGNQRQVLITGEAWFEVAKDKTKPFLVKTGNTTIEVTGTQFNVNAYTDEAGISTTLLEGSVKISSGKQQQLLTPGQQAIVHNNGSIHFIKEAATDQAIAWKNGIFSFEKADLPAVMRQLSRWYDVDIVYQGTPPVRYFAGDIERSLHLSQVLKILSRMNIQFRIEDQQLIILPS